MKESRIYSCPYCKAILVLPKSCWQSSIRCTICDKEMKLLDDEFDLAEIIDCETTNNKPECETGCRS